MRRRDLLKLAPFAPAVLRGQILAPIISGSESQAYYADSVAGDDGNLGTLAAPVKTIAQLAVLDAASPRNVWRLKKDSVWREQLSVPRDSMTVESYGSGTNKPLLDCSNAIASGAWTKTGGRTNVYQATVSPALTASNTQLQVWENGAALTRKGSVADCDATAGSFYPASDTTAPVVVYVHPSGNTNPATDGKTYEFASRPYGVYAQERDHVTIRGIAARRNLHYSGSIVAGRYALIDSCQADDGVDHAVYVKRGSTVRNTSANNTEPLWPAGTGGIIFVYNDDDPNGENVLFDGCTAENSVFREDIQSFGGHKNAGSNFGTATYRNCTSTNVGVGFRTDNTGTTVIDGCTVAGARYSVQQWGYGTYQITGSNLATYASGALGAALMLTAGATATVEDTTLTSPFRCIDTSPGSPIALTLTGCTLNGHAAYGLSLNHASSVVTVRGTTFDHIGVVYGMPSPGVIDSDYNIFAVPEYGEATGFYFEVNNTQYHGLTAYRAGTGQDMHSTPLP